MCGAPLKVYKEFSVYSCHLVGSFVAVDFFDCNLLSLTSTVAEIGDRMRSLYCVQISELECGTQKQLEDGITFLVKAQSQLHIPLKSVSTHRQHNETRDSTK